MSVVENEKRMVAKMIALYCKAHHRTEGLCSDCAELTRYAHKRLSRCAYQEQKTSCSKCPTHCYKPDMRSRIKDVMRYSGKRMLLHAPLDTLRHLLATFRS